jgi:hypothetical protein
VGGVRNEQRKEEGKMRKLLKSGIFLMVMVLILAPTLVQAFNSLAHIYIAEQIFPDCYRKIDLGYGGIKPDLAMFVPEWGIWEGDHDARSNAYEDTHFTYADLRSYAWPWSSAQKAFAKGWLTHGIADSYADEYITEKEDQLVGCVKALHPTWEPSPAEESALAHHAIEKAIDLLLKYNDDTALPKKLCKCVQYHSRQDHSLLVKVFVWKHKRTNLLTLATTESVFCGWTSLYAMALSLPYPWDQEALVRVGVQMAPMVYGVEIPHEILQDALKCAIDLCYEDYMFPIEDTIEYFLNDSAITK